MNIEQNYNPDDLVFPPTKKSKSENSTLFLEKLKKISQETIRFSKGILGLPEYIIKRKAIEEKKELSKKTQKLLMSVGLSFALLQNHLFPQKMENNLTDKISSTNVKTKIYQRANLSSPNINQQTFSDNNSLDVSIRIHLRDQEEANQHEQTHLENQDIEKKLKKLKEKFINPEKTDDVIKYVKMFVKQYNTNPENKTKIQLKDCYDLFIGNATSYYQGSLCKNEEPPVDGVTAAVPPQYDYFYPKWGETGSIVFVEFIDSNKNQGHNPGYFIGTDTGRDIDGVNIIFDLRFSSPEICDRLGNRPYLFIVLKKKFVELLEKSDPKITKKIKYQKQKKLPALKKFILSNKFDTRINY